MFNKNLLEKQQNKSQKIKLYNKELLQGAPISYLHKVT